MIESRSARLVAVEARLREGVAAVIDENEELGMAVATRDGTTLVIRHGDRYEVLASNTLDDGFDASPAIVDDEIYMRGYRYLYAIAEG